jgi:hypothetical protein
VTDSGERDAEILREHIEALSFSGPPELVYTSALPRADGALAALDRLLAENARLREALDEIARIDSPFAHSHGVFRDIARTALSPARADSAVEISPEGRA